MDSKIQQFEQQIPDFLNRFSDKLRTGYSVRQILENIGNELPEPMAGETKQVCEEVRSGISVQQALDHWLTRMPSADLTLIVTTINVQHQLGGNLADDLDFIGEVIRVRKSR